MLRDLGELHRDGRLEIERVFCRKERAGFQQVAPGTAVVFQGRLGECPTVECFRCGVVPDKHACLGHAEE